MTILIREGTQGTILNLSEAKAAFCDALREVGTVQHAAARLGINRRTAYAWREADAEFAANWDAAVEDSSDVLEESLYQRALDDKGMPAVVAAIASLKARRPQRWSEKHIIVPGEGVGELAAAMSRVADLIQRANPRAQVSIEEAAPQVLEGQSTVVA